MNTGAGVERVRDIRVYTGWEEKSFTFYFLFREWKEEDGEDVHTCVCVYVCVRD